MREAIEMALKTWYPEEHPLHLNPHHPLGKLLGEWGELLDDYMKSLYKPGYEFKPKNELGDIWYYIRILVHQTDYTLEDHYYFEATEKTEGLIGQVIWNVARVFSMSVESGQFNAIQIRNSIDWSHSVLLEICNRYELNLDQLTASNWEKLKPGSERGDEWAKARDT